MMMCHTFSALQELKYLQTQSWDCRLVKLAYSLHLCHHYATKQGYQSSADLKSKAEWLVIFSECVPETVPARVQGGSCEEVPLYPAALQHVQGSVGLVNPSGNFLCRSHSALQRLLCQPWWGPWPSATCQPQYHRQWHCCRDALHSWYNIFEFIEKNKDAVV